MKMIVDSNYLQCEALRDYLSASTENCAVLTDYAAMEAFKGNTQVIYRSMEILAESPNQVIVLKSTQDVCGISPSDAVRPDGLIDFDQTRGFAAFCYHLARAKCGDPSLRMQLAQSGREAAAHMDRILADMPQLNLGIEQIAATYSAEELKILRRREPLTPKMGEKLIHQVMLLAGELFSKHPRVAEVPGGPEVRNTFIFRHAICAYALALRAIEDGAGGRARPQKLRNDYVDVNFATFATFFDGLLSADKKAQSIYVEAKFLLREISRGRAVRDEDLGSGGQPAEVKKGGTENSNWQYQVRPASRKHEP